MDGAVRRGWHWLTTRSPHTILAAGWLCFTLSCYPGYLSVNSALQLYEVRVGSYTDYAPLMTWAWSLLEYAIAGPVPMLLLQSGLFLFGLAALLGRVLSPRAAAVAAVILLLFPPVFAPMAVIWPSSLAAGALLAGAAAFARPTRRGKAFGAALFVLACSCVPEAVVAVAPLAWLGLPQARWRRVALTVGVAVACSGAARGADAILTDTDTYRWKQQLMVMDTVATLHRAHLKDPRVLGAALAGLPSAVSEAERHRRFVKLPDSFDWWPAAHGDSRVVDPIETDDQAAALAAAWRHAIASYPYPYLVHRAALAAALLGFGDAAAYPVYDGFGPPELLEPIHVRATSSAWEDDARAIVTATARTPVFWVWIYLVLAVVALGLGIAWRAPTALALALSALAWELTMFAFAPGVDYRCSHWLVTMACAALAALVGARGRWRAAPTAP